MVRMFTLAGLLVSGLVTLGLANAPLKVATSFSILEDMVNTVGGKRVQITNFVPRDGDTHTFEPGTRDVKALSDAKLVFVNGLGLEGWFERLLKNAGSKTKVVTLSQGLKPMMGEAHEGESHGEFDPHLWWDLRNAQAYVKRISGALEQADPAGKTVYASNSKTYLRELEALDAWAKLEVAKVPIPQRKLVTNHDSLGYFAARYGFKIVGQVIPGLGTERSPSAKEMAELTKAIKREGVKAIFTENTLSAKLAQTIAKETGAKIAPPLFTDALGPAGSAGDTFVKAFRYNVNTIVNALR